MKTLLKIELERALKNKWFYITLLIELILVIVDVVTVALPARRAYEDIYIQFRDYQIPGAYCLWMVANCSSVYKLFHLIFPLLISIPYTYTIYNDVKSNYIYLLHIATPTATSAITEVSLLFYQTHTYNILLLQR